MNVERDFPLAQMKTVYQLDLPSPQGISGSPVVVVYDNELYVAGYIIGEMTSNNKPAAISTNADPFFEIERLLIDISKKLRPSNEK